MKNKRKKPTAAQQRARKEYQRIRKNERNRAYYYRKKGYEPVMPLPEALPKGLTAREYKRGIKELKEYRETNIYVKKPKETPPPDEIDVLIAMIWQKIESIAEPARKLSKNEISGKSLLKEWFRTSLSTNGKQETVRVVQQMEDNGYPIDQGLRYENTAKQWVDMAMQLFSTKLEYNEAMTALLEDSQDWNGVKE